MAISFTESGVFRAKAPEGFEKKSKREKRLEQLRALRRDRNIFTRFAADIKGQKEGVEDERGEVGLVGGAVGFGKRLLKSAKESAELGSKATSLPITPVTLAPKLASQAAGRLSESIPEDFTTPEGVAERQGAAVATVAEFFIPSSYGGKIGTSAVKTLVKSTKPQRDLKKVLQTIAEPLSKKNIRRGLQKGEEGVVRGSRMLGLFKRPDELLPTDRTQRAAQTVLNEISNAPRLTDAQVVTQAQHSIAKIGADLGEDLIKIPVDTNKTVSLIDNYASVRSELAQGFYDQSEITALNKISKTFEGVLADVIDAKNLDDVWKARIKFDKAVNNNIKEAIEGKNIGQDAAKEIWLGYREILNTFIEATADDISDEIVKFRFKKMSDLYTAIGNITARADFDKKGSNAGIKRLLRFVGGGAATGLGINVIQ